MGPQIMKPCFNAAILFLFLLCQTGCGKKSASVAETPPPAPQKQIVPLTNMVAVKAGQFLRGKHVITLTHDYWIAKYEVTQGEFMALMGTNPSHFTGDTNRPVEKVKQVDAAAYCAAITRRERAAGKLPDGLAYRLPTEAEWENACRAGSTNQFSFGDDTALADQFAWTSENADAATHPIGQKKSNAWGLHDMHGNVWEWCADWFEPYPQMNLTDPIGPSTSKFKVFRGGSWNHAIEFARSSNRFMMAADAGIHFVGFRIALGVELPVGPVASTLPPPAR